MKESIALHVLFAFQLVFQMPTNTFKCPSWAMAGANAAIYRRVYHILIGTGWFDRRWDFEFDNMYRTIGEFPSTCDWTNGETIHQSQEKEKNTIKTN